MALERRWDLLRGRHQLVRMNRKDDCTLAISMTINKIIVGPRGRDPHNVLIWVMDLQPAYPIDVTPSIWLIEDAGLTTPRHREIAQALANVYDATYWPDEESRRVFVTVFEAAIETSQLL